MGEQSASRRRYLLWIGGALVALLVIVVVSVLAYGRHTAIDSVSADSTGNNGFLPQAVLSNTVKSIRPKSTVSAPMPLYKQLVNSRFLLSSLFGLAALAVAVIIVTVFTFNQTKESLDITPKDEESKSLEAENEVEENWLNQNPLITGVIIAGAILLFVILIVLFGRFLKGRRVSEITGKDADGKAKSKDGAVDKTKHAAKSSKKNADQDYSANAEECGVDENGVSTIYARAIAEYVAVDTSQLTCVKGNVYLMKKVDEDGHWYQLLKKGNDKPGWAPASYFETKVGGKGNWEKVNVTADYFQPKPKAPVAC